MASTERQFTQNLEFDSQMVYSGLKKKVAEFCNAKQMGAEEYYQRSAWLEKQPEEYKQKVDQAVVGLRELYG